MDKDTLLSRWLNNELTDAEIEQLKASGDWEVLEKIISETNLWKLPAMKEENYNQIQNKLKGKETKVVPMNRFAWTLSAAASIVLLIAATYWFFVRVEITTVTCEAGQTLNVTLPDSIEVTLTGKSSIAYARKRYLKRRNIKLTGQAYFNVKRKGRMVVSFDQGEVTVLGTRFDIISGKDFAMIKCYEGKVEVTSAQSDTQLLTPGMGVRLQTEVKSERFEFVSQDPGWLNGESTFDDAPLREVLEALSIQYNIDIDYSKIDADRKYTGKFIHSSLDRSFKMVLNPMGISVEPVTASARRAYRLKVKS